MMMIRKSEIEKWVVFIGFYVLWIFKGKDTNKKSWLWDEIRVWEVGSPASGCDDVAGWLSVGGGKPLLLYWKVRYFCWCELQLRHLCWWEFETCLLIGQDMKAEPCILICQSWIMHSDWSEHDDWNMLNWTMSCDWSELDD